MRVHLPVLPRVMLRRFQHVVWWGDVLLASFFQIRCIIFLRVGGDYACSNEPGNTHLRLRYFTLRRHFESHGSYEKEAITIRGNQHCGLIRRESRGRQGR